MGGIDIQVKMPGAKKRAQDKQGRHQQSSRIENRQGRIYAAKQKGLTIGVQPYHEDQPHPQKHELDPPAHGPDRRPVRALKVHQHQYRGDQQQRVQRDSGRSQAQQRRSRLKLVDLNNQASAEQQAKCGR